MCVKRFAVLETNGIVGLLNEGHPTSTHCEIVREIWTISQPESNESILGFSG